MPRTLKTTQLAKTEFNNTTIWYRKCYRWGTATATNNNCSTSPRKWWTPFKRWVITPLTTSWSLATVAEKCLSLPTNNLSCPCKGLRTHRTIKKINISSTLKFSQSSNRCTTRPTIVSHKLSSSQLRTRLRRPNVMSISLSPKLKYWGWRNSSLSKKEFTRHNRKKMRENSSARPNNSCKVATNNLHRLLLSKLPNKVRRDPLQLCKSGMASSSSSNKTCMRYPLTLAKYLDSKPIRSSSTTLN